MFQHVRWILFERSLTRTNVMECREKRSLMKAWTEMERRGRGVSQPIDDPQV